MPRSTPAREIQFTIGEDAIKEALVSWTEKYHGIRINTKDISLASGDDPVSATVVKRPSRSKGDKANETKE